MLWWIRTADLTDSVVPPALDKNQGFLEAVEDFPVEKLISEFAVEGLAVAILPRASWFNIGCLHTDLGKPLAQRDGNQFRVIVRTNVSRHTPGNHLHGERLEYIHGLDMTGHDQRQAFTCVFIEKDKHSEFTVVVCLATDEVIAPDMIPIKADSSARGIA